MSFCSVTAAEGLLALESGLSESALRPALQTWRLKILASGAARMWPEGLTDG